MTHNTWCTFKNEEYSIHECPAAGCFYAVKFFTDGSFPEMLHPGNHKVLHMGSYSDVPGSKLEVGGMELIKSTRGE